MKPICRFLVIALAAILSYSKARAEPVALRCDGSSDATAIDLPHPPLSWILRPDHPGDRNIRQTAYQILVASSPEFLSQNRGDLWDSGRVNSSQTLHIPYAGAPLYSAEQVFWKVRAWVDKDGAPDQIDAPNWSIPATFVTGMLSPEDWAPAKWISAPDAQRLGLGYHASPTPDPHDSKWVQIDLGAPQHIDNVRLYPVFHVNVAGFAFPIRFQVETASDPSFEHSTVIADHTTVDFPSPGMNLVDIPANLTARYIRVTATKLHKYANGYCFALSELAVLSNGKNIALGKPVQAKDSVEHFGWTKAALTDGVLGYGKDRFPSMLLRRTFSVRPSLTHAILSVTGLGQYELSINGKKVGDQLLAPGWTNYKKTVLYNTFDVTDTLKQGENGIGIILGNGMYNIEATPGRYVKFTQSFGPPKAIAKLTLHYTDGSTDTLATDCSWQVSPGPITYSNIFGGEDFDSRLEQPGWDGANFSGGPPWEPAIATDGPGGALRGHSVSAPPIRAIETQTPISKRMLRPDITVYDLGQNASHMPRLTVRGPAGSYVRIIPSELLFPNGYVDRASCVQDAGGPAWWQYTLNGSGDEHYFPKFFYQGCRYLQVELFPATPGGQLPVVESLKGVVVHSSSEPISTFHCSNDLFNKIYTLVRWAQRSNMMSLMTDCPTREKLGWLEELHLNGPSLRYNFRLDRLYAKEMNDMADAQLENGFVPNIAPEYFIAASSRLNDPFRDSPEWGSSFIIVPWQQYLFTGDLSLLRTHYDQMVRYAAFLASTAKDNILTVGLGDWYDLGPKPPWGSQLTPPPLTATATSFYDLTILAHTADLLGKPEDAGRFRTEAARIRDAFNHRFYNPDKGNYATNSQCANAMPLALDIVEPEHRNSVLQALITDIQNRGNALTAGDVGYRYVLRALADAGRSDIVFAMNNQSDRPGYGMQIKRGATSLTEKWDASVGSFGSQDHFMLGQINEWLFHDLAGIQYDDQPPYHDTGFAHIRIKPAPVGDISSLDASYFSDHGPISIHWQRQSDGLHLRVSIPPNTTATLLLPSSTPASVRELHPTNEPATVSGAQAGYAVFSTGSGDYEFLAP